MQSNSDQDLVKRIDAVYQPLPGDREKKPLPSIQHQAQESVDRYLASDFGGSHENAPFFSPIVFERSYRLRDQ
jgi:trimethylamine:corrinoid methyltransferase-like protein